MRDVSERRKFERELQETQKLEGLGLLAGGIAHDFNNLLTGILGNASLLSETSTDQPMRFRLRFWASSTGQRSVTCNGFDRPK
jgi:nitrogen-specific signal transduction histidine kinase